MIMTSLEFVALTLQLLVPTGLIGHIAFGRHPDRLRWVLEVLAAAAWLGAIALAGLWLVLPRGTAWLLLVLLAAAAVFSAPFAGRRPVARPPPPRRIGLVVRGSLALASTVVATWAWLGHRPLDAPSVDVAFPLQGGTYLVAAGGSNALVNPHLKTLDGDRYARYRGQSHGIDLVAVGAWGSRVSGLSPDEPAGFAIFGDSIHAPCTGTVVAAADGHPDRSTSDGPPETLEGNHVVLACGDAWIVLAHMLRGSVAVEEDDRLERGTLLGRVGNSGSSDEPHLHIHAQTPGTLDAPLSGRPLQITFDGRRLVRNDRVHTTSAAPSTRSLTTLSSTITRPGGREP